MNQLHIFPAFDGEELAGSHRKALDIPRQVARELGQSAVAASREGSYINRHGQQVDFRDAVESACRAKISISPNDPLPVSMGFKFSETRIQVSNESTLGASRRLMDQGLRPLALNFANGISPGGGFLNGARAQEENLCRSSALYLTIVGDRMYEEHAKRSLPDSTAWCILSPDVPVFRGDDGSPLDKPWPLSFITCAAPVVGRIGAEESAALLKIRIHRVLAVAQAHGYESLVLGAWGCGAFGNDPGRTAVDFRNALESEFRGAFKEVVFAITDWSPERKFLGPFRDVFSSEHFPVTLSEDSYHLQRFLDAQSEHYTHALAELRRGRKTTHWMWFVFPQIAGLGSSGTAQFYAIKSLDEAVAFMRHPVLGTRLAECCEALLAHEERTAHEILGFPDDLKLRSCVTLFSIAEPQNPLYLQVIHKFFDGVQDRKTIDIIRSLADPL